MKTVREELAEALNIGIGLSLDFGEVAHAGNRDEIVAFRKTMRAALARHAAEPETKIQMDPVIGITLVPSNTSDQIKITTSVSAGCFLSKGVVDEVVCQAVRRLFVEARKGGHTRVIEFDHCVAQVVVPGPAVGVSFADPMITAEPDPLPALMELLRVAIPMFRFFRKERGAPTVIRSEEVDDFCHAVAACSHIAIPPRGEEKE